MSIPLKTTISCREDIFDMEGQWLPKGNYYFSVTNLSSGAVEGRLVERSFQASYRFRPKDIIMMMSNAQARLARRANIVHEYMPDVPSPRATRVTNLPDVENRPVRLVSILSAREPRVVAADILPERPSSDTDVRDSTSRSSQRSSNGNPLCPICLEEVIESENNRKVLHCNHTFHANCINRWLTTRNQCPVCRRRVPSRPRGRMIPPPSRVTRRSIPRTNLPRNIRRTAYTDRQASRNRRREYNRQYSSNFRIG
jgi:hypothetical protein